MSKAISIYEAIKKFGWKKPGSYVSGVEILLGDNCNAKCVFCCSHNGLGNWISIERVKKILDKAKEKKSWFISFSGGEAVLYPYILEAISYAKNKNFKMIQILSNGIKLSDFNFATKIVYAGANEFKISLHSVYKEKHDFLVGVKGAFFAVLKSFENLNKLKVKASSNFAINNLNYKEIPLWTRFIYEKYGITGFCYMFSFYSGKMLNSELSVSYSKVIPYLQTALEYIKKNKIVIESKMLSNFLPCLAPQYANLMIDLDTKKKYSHVVSSGKIVDNRKFYNTRKKLLKKCRECIYYKNCLGVDKGYIEKFGESEFIPVKKQIKLELPNPLYK